MKRFAHAFYFRFPRMADLRFMTPIRGCAAYQLNWFDAQIWSCAEHYGLTEILTEDLPT